MAEKKSSQSSEEKKKQTKSGSTGRDIKIGTPGPNIYLGTEVHIEGILDPKMATRDAAIMFGYSTDDKKATFMRTLKAMGIDVHITPGTSYPHGFIRVAHLKKWLDVQGWTEDQARALLTELDPYYGKSEAERRMERKRAAEQMAKSQPQPPPAPVGEIGGVTMIVPDDTDNREEANTNVAKRARSDDDDDEEGQAAVAIRQAFRGFNERVAKLEDELVNIFTESKQKKQKKKMNQKK